MIVVDLLDTTTLYYTFFTHQHSAKMLINSLLFIIGLMAVNALPLKRQQATKLGGVNLAVRSRHLSYMMKLIPGMRVWNDYRGWKWIVLLSGHGPDHSFHIERSESVRLLPFFLSYII